MGLCTHWLKVSSTDLTMNINGREISDLVISGVQLHDFPDFSEAHIEDAKWADTGEALSIDELDHATEVYQNYIIRLIERCCKEPDV